MKRRILAGMAVLIIVFVIYYGFQTAVDPSRFTGIWYSTTDYVRYIFSEGIIYKDSTEAVNIDQCFSGAYIFCKDHVLLFSQTQRGLESLKLLYLVHLTNGDALCENQDGEGEIYYFRNKEDISTYK